MFAILEFLSSTRMQHKIKTKKKKKSNFSADPGTIFHQNLSKSFGDEVHSGGPRPPHDAFISCTFFFWQRILKDTQVCVLVRLAKCSLNFNGKCNTWI